MKTDSVEALDFLFDSDVLFEERDLEFFRDMKYPPFQLPIVCVRRVPLQKCSTVTVYSSIII